VQLEGSQLSAIGRRHDGRIERLQSGAVAIEVEQVGVVEINDVNIKLDTHYNDEIK
jgi:hypothetical protein